MTLIKRLVKAVLAVRRERMRYLKHHQLRTCTGPTLFNHLFLPGKPWTSTDVATCPCSTNWTLERYNHCVIKMARNASVCTACSGLSLAKDAHTLKSCIKLTLHNTTFQPTQPPNSPSPSSPHRPSSQLRLPSHLRLFQSRPRQVQRRRMRPRQPAPTLCSSSPLPGRLETQHLGC